jgi:hypothetical protein
MNLDIKRFEAADEIRRFPLGTFEVVQMGGLTIGRASYEPGWRWSEHVGPITGATSCKVEHAGLVLSGRAAVRMDDGHEFVMEAGDLFTVPAGTTAGSWATSRTSRCISWAPATTRPSRLSTGSATHAVADVGRLRRVDHPNDLQLDARRQLLEQPTSATEEHGGLVDL